MQRVAWADIVRADRDSPHSPFLISVRFHWPMQGPQALASTVPPAFWKISSMPSRSMVALQPREAWDVSSTVVTLCHSACPDAAAPALAKHW